MRQRKLLTHILWNFFFLAHISHIFVIHLWDFSNNDLLRDNLGKLDLPNQDSISSALIFVKVLIHEHFGQLNKWGQDLSLQVNKVSLEVGEESEHFTTAWQDKVVEFTIVHVEVFEKLEGLVTNLDVFLKDSLCLDWKRSFSDHHILVLFFGAFKFKIFSFKWINHWNFYIF